MDDFSGKLFWNDVSRILAETVVALEELQERYACHRLTSKQAQAKIKVIMERLTLHYSVDYWQEFSERYSDENDFIGNNFDCEYYHEILALQEKVKDEAIDYGVDVKNLMEFFENVKLGLTESEEEKEERKWYEIDKRALEDILYYKRKCLDEYFIRERIINYEKNHKKKDQEKSEYMTIFDNVMKLFE